MSNFISIKTRILTLFFLAVMLLSLEGLLYAENNEEKYNPCPIVFVHGYNVLPKDTSKYDLWQKASKEFQKYFFVNPDDPYNSEFKYHNERLYNYETVFDYREMSEGDIEEIAGGLANYVDKVIKRLPAYQKKKVIIVAHSMGGLVTRRMLSMNDKNGKSYQEKVAKVVFVDSPLLGSPLASGVILIDRLRPDLEQKKKDYAKYADLDIGFNTSPTALAYYDLYNQIDGHLKFCELLVGFNKIITVKDMLSGYSKKPNPYGAPKPEEEPARYNPYLANHYEGQKVAIGELVVPATVEASKVFVGNAKIRDSVFGGIVICSTEPVRAESHYGKSETFLNNKANVLATPDNFRTISGAGGKKWFLGKAGSAVFKMFANYSGLPDGNKLEDLDTGDGIVTTLSQTALAHSQNGPNSQIYPIEAFHFDAPNAWKTILDAIDDDPPVIESMKVVSADMGETGRGAEYSVYVVAGIKEYLLADIRFSYLTLDDRQADLGEFYEMGNDYEELPFKPYVKFAKDFLKKRQDPDITDSANNPQTLLPGEFYVKLDTEGNDAHVVKLKMKNPAEKESDEKIVQFQRPIIDNEKPTGSVADNRRPVIQARVHSPLEVDIDVKSLRMMLDDVNIPSDKLVVTDMGFDVTFKYTPDSDLDEGCHTVVVNGKDIYGLPAQEKEWTFFVGQVLVDWKETWTNASGSITNYRHGIYPIMRDTKEFYLGWLYGDGGYYYLQYRWVGCTEGWLHSYAAGGGSSASYSFKIEAADGRVNFDAETSAALSKSEYYRVHDSTVGAELNMGMYTTVFVPHPGPRNYYFLDITDSSILTWDGSPNMRLGLEMYDYPGGAQEIKTEWFAPGTYDLSCFSGKWVVHALVRFADDIVVHTSGYPDPYDYYVGTQYFPYNPYCWEWCYWDKYWIQASAEINQGAIGEQCDSRSEHGYVGSIRITNLLRW